MGHRRNKNKIVYSTNPDFIMEADNQVEIETLPAAKQNLLIRTDRKNRRGKTVTLIAGFIGQKTDLITLSKKLKTVCGVGGTVKNGEILIQGNHLDKIVKLLKKENFNLKCQG
ncbi:MAG: translation initiation factor [Candidatus Marinimicrobia bacterium]|nr:translation initiation factor [Candidatus Neomarinimicrobiota bacterium]